MIEPVNKSKRFWLLSIPVLLLIATSLPTLLLGYDTEVVIGFIHPFMFGKVSLNFFTNLASGTPMQFVNYTAFRPLYYLNFNLDYLLYGANIFFYRLENVLWLGLVWLLLWRLAGKLGMHDGGRLAMGLAFAVHPAHVFMMQAIFSRTDLVAAVFIGAVINLFLSGTGHGKRTWQYWTSLGFFALSFLWKELFLIIPLLLLLLDLGAKWTVGSTGKRLLFHLPYWIVAGLAIIMQLALTGTLGYSRGDAEVSQAVWGFLPQLISFLNALWGLDGWGIAWLGAALTLLLFIIGPWGKLRFALIFTILLLVPYLIVWSSFMHVFLASLGLALWSGFLLDWLCRKNRLLWIIPVAALAVFLIVSWARLYADDLPQQLHTGNRISRVVEFVHREYPQPPAGAVFTLAQNEWVQSGDVRKVLLRANYILQVLYRRDDVYIVPQRMATSEFLPVETTRIEVHLPDHIVK